MQLVATLILFRLRTGVVYPFVPLAAEALRRLANSTLLLYTVLIFAQAILSFVPGARNSLTSMLDSLCAPVLRPIRRILPVARGRTNRVDDLRFGVGPGFDCFGHLQKRF